MNTSRPSVLITGAARRLGATLTRRFAAAGWHVVIHHRDSCDEAEALAASLPSAETVAFDLADTAAIRDACARLAMRLPDWRVLVNCASVFDFDGAERIDEVIFAEAMAVNARAPVLLAQAFLARAGAADGRTVINVIDQKLANMNPDFFSYTMAKAALAAASEMMAISCQGTPDRVHALHPGAMLPSFDQADFEHESSGRMNLLHRLTQPEELADAALFLATGALANGRDIFVDSGQHLMAQDRDVLFLARKHS